MPTDSPWTSTTDPHVDDVLDGLLKDHDPAGQKIDDHLDDLLRQWNQRLPALRRRELLKTSYVLKPFQSPACEEEDVLEAYVGVGKGSSRTHRIYLTMIEDRREMRFLHLAEKSGNNKSQRNDADLAAGRAKIYRSRLKEERENE